MNFSQMIEELSIKHHNKLKKFCAPLFQTLPIGHFYFQYHSANGKHNAISTHIDYMLNFCEENLYKHIPFITNFNWNSNSIYLVNSVSESKYQNYQQFIDQMSVKLKFRHDLSITRKSDSCCYEYGFGTHEKSDMNVLINHIPLITKFIDHFNSNFSKEVKNTMFNNPVDLKKELGHFYCGKQNTDKNIYSIEDAKMKSFYSKIDNNDEIDLFDTKLSNREIEILKLYFKGQSNSEVARILHLSPRTIQNYLEKIKEKLFCNKKSELFERLEYMKQIGLHQEIFS